MARAPAAAACCCLALALLLTLTRAAPSYADYDSVRDLYELLLQREALEGRLAAQQQPPPPQLAQLAQSAQPPHQLVRKANRSPSLRLRFGRRADPLLAAGSFLDHPALEPAPADQ